MENAFIGLKLLDLFCVEARVSDAAAGGNMSMSFYPLRKNLVFDAALAGWTSHKLASLCSAKMAADQLSLQPETTLAPCAIHQQQLGKEGWALVPHLYAPSLPGPVGTLCQVHYEGRKAYPA